MKEIKIFAPATVANVSCGFDALGLALENQGDEMIFRRTASKELKITHISGADLPYDIDKNLVGIVAKTMLTEQNANFGLEIEIYKGFMPGSGLGSSAASASGTAFAVNELLGKPYDNLQLTEFAMLGEEAVSGSKFADNVAAVLYGGFVLIRGYEPLDIVSLPVPNDLYITALHPEIEVKTSEARALLPKEIPLKSAIAQWANVGGLVAGLCTNNYELISRSLQDVIVEPHRKKLIPHFDEVKQAALDAGALGAGISGSGPTIFALSKNETTANAVFEKIKEVYKPKGIDHSIFNSKINTEGVKIIETN